MFLLEADLFSSDIQGYLGSQKEKSIKTVSAFDFYSEFRLFWD